MGRATVTLVAESTAATCVARAEGYSLDDELRPPPLRKSRYGVD